MIADQVRIAPSWLRAAPCSTPRCLPLPNTPVHVSSARASPESCSRMAPFGSRPPQARTTRTAPRARSQPAAFAVGADGANSLVRGRVLTAFRRDQLSIATGFFAHGVTSREIVVELLSDPPGYIWSFPRPDHLAIGICGQADAGITAAALRAKAAAWIAATGLADGA